MKKVVFIILSLIIGTHLFAQTDPYLYAHLYEGCVDDEPSPIYGGSYNPYPKDMIDAQFPGGDVELSLFIHQNTERQEVYSGETDENGKSLLVTGEVLVQFVIDRCGKPGRFQIIQSLTEEQDAEALRIMESLPIFKAATLNGYRVKSAYIAPVKFKWKYMPEPEPEPVYDDSYYDDWW
jgi:hypothetical protein